MGRRLFRSFKPLDDGGLIRRDLNRWARTLTGPDEIVAALRGKSPEYRLQVVQFVGRRMRIALTEAQIAWVMEELAKDDKRRSSERQFVCDNQHVWRGQRSEPQTCATCGGNGMLVLAGDDDPAAFEDSTGEEPANSSKDGQADAARAEAATLEARP